MAGYGKSDGDDPQVSARRGVAGASYADRSSRGGAGILERLLRPFRRNGGRGGSRSDEPRRSWLSFGRKGLSAALVDGVASGRVETVRELLHEGADPDAAVGRSGRTALIIAAEVGFTDIVRALLDAGANVEAQSRASGRNPLMRASQHGFLPIVKMLLNHGADVNTRSTVSGRTALMRAARNGHYETVETLLVAGAIVNARDKRGYTALDLARKHFRLEVAQLLLSHGAQTGAPTEPRRETSRFRRRRPDVSGDYEVSDEFSFRPEDIERSREFDPSLESLAQRIREIHQKRPADEDRRRLLQEISAIEESYAVLGCDPSSSDEAIKSTYRRLAKEYHPDNIRGKDLPADFSDFANKRFLEIKEAYERISRHRRMSDS